MTQLSRILLSTELGISDEDCLLVVGDIAIETTPRAIRFDELDPKEFPKPLPIFRLSASHHAIYLDATPYRLLVGFKLVWKTACPSKNFEYS